MFCELGCFLLGAITFPSLFILISNNIRVKIDEKRYEISVRLVSAVQGIIAVAVGYVTMKNTENDVVLSRYPLLDWSTWFWLPYLYYDAWAMYKTHVSNPLHIKGQTTLLSRLKGFIIAHPLMMVHHLLLPPVYGPSILVLRKGKGDFFVGCAFLMEATIPFISARFILLELGLKNTWMYIINGFFTMISFGIFRLLIWVYMVQCYAVYRNVPFIDGFFLLPTICKVSTIAFFLINLYWFIKIVLLVKRGVVSRFFSKEKIVD